ncbi:MAG: lipoxygenase family protein [Myxococcales bacterium]|nr:lipoxygenase family protein [Myxococcales bacterium]
MSKPKAAPTVNFAALPAPIRQFSRALATPPAAPAADQEAATPTDFVYAYSEADRTYTAPRYPAGGVWNGHTTPWLNDIATIKDASWLWNAEDTAAQDARQKQVATQKEAMKPAGPYSGTTAERITQRFTQGMWSESVFPKEQLASLFVWIDDDAEFARQRLGGANTNVIAAATDFNLSDWIGAAKNSAELAQLHATLRAAQQAGTLYICDYRPVFRSVIQRNLVQTGTHLAAPVCMFTVEGAELKPQAIQITATDATSYIFTPGDAKDPDGDAWLLAKLWAANADEAWWFSGTHLYNTHSIDMIFGIAALNRIEQGGLPADHPMLRLAKPHMVKSFNINSVVYNSAAPGGGIYQSGLLGPDKAQQFCDAVLPTGRIGIYETINNLYRDYTFEAQAFDVTMAERGLSGTALDAVSFPYRDDGRVWSNAIGDFVASIVDASYADDAAVAADDALNGWMGMVETAFNRHPGAGPRFSWTPDRDTLKKTFANLIFLCSAQHCAVNDSMFAAYAFTPNGPFSMQKAPPTDAASVSQQTVLDSLPDPAVAGSDGSATPTSDLNTIQNQIAFVMSGTPKVSEWIGGTGTAADLQAVYGYESGSAQAKAVAGFYQAIWVGDQSVKATITGNQQRRVEAYRSRASGAVPNSVYYYYLSPEAVGSMFLNAAATRAIQV